MKKKTPLGNTKTDPHRQLKQARITYMLLEAALQSHVQAVQNKTNLPSETTLSTSLNNYHKVLVLIQELEAKLEKRGEIIRQSGGGRLDIKSARAEVLARLARIRERTAD